MPQVDFFCDSEDEHSLVMFILDQEGWLVASSQQSCQYEPITTWEAYQAARVGGGQQWALENEKLFMVLFDSYQECPLDLHAVEGGYYKGTYSVTPRTGGPAIDFLTSNFRYEGSNQIVSDGFVGFYPSYQNTITGDIEQTPKALIDQYRAIVRHLKKNSVTIKAHTGREYVIGPHTFPRVKSGELKMGVQGLELPPNLRV